MTREIEAYWEAKRRLERKLLIGAGALLLVLGSAACAEGPTGPYSELEPQQGATTETLEARQSQETTRCGDIEVSEAVCEKGLGDPSL